MRYPVILGLAAIAACNQLTGVPPAAKVACAGRANADTVAQHYYVTSAGDTVLIGPANSPAGSWWQTTIVAVPCAGR